MALAAADLQQTENGLSQWREPPAEVDVETLKPLLLFSHLDCNPFT